MYNVNNDSSLIDFFKTINISKNKVKTYVKLGFIKVNEKKVSKLPFNVKKGDIVSINKTENIDYKFRITYEDNNYLVVDKEAGLLTISTSSTNKNNEDTLYKKVRYYLKKKNEFAFTNSFLIIF